MSTGKTYVLIIAVENYHDDTSFPKVNYALKDATDLQAAFLTLGYDADDITLLTNEKATSTAVLHHLKRIARLAQQHDRIIFYFAGHGFYEDGKNLLATADAIKSDKESSCVSINTVLGILKKSACEHNILFLDTCHSGFTPGEFIRDGNDTFLADELILQFSREEYCIGFASCKTNQTSFSHPKLKNGVWSHYLIKALKGEAKNIYNKGLLFSDALQSYLKENTSQFVKLNTTEKSDQTPLKFGAETDKFIIANVNPILEKKKLAKKTAPADLAKISLLTEESDLISNLSGFQRRRHKVPDYIGGAPNSFVKDIGFSMLEEDINRTSRWISEKMNYKRKEVTATVDKGYGSIITPDFDYSVTIEQSQKYAEHYEFCRRLDNIKNPAILKDPQFNDVFSRSFDTVSFEFKKLMDIEHIIDTIEEMDSPKVKVHYDNTDLTWCRIDIASLHHYIYVYEHSFHIGTDGSTPPALLVEAYQKARKEMLLYEEMKLLTN